MGGTGDGIFWNADLSGKETTDKIHINAWRSHDNAAQNEQTELGASLSNTTM